jgi:hypothetical protein
MSAHSCGEDKPCRSCESRAEDRADRSFSTQDAEAEARRAGDRYERQLFGDGSR